jgi:hypothetical protein
MGMPGGDRGNVLVLVGKRGSADVKAFQAVNLITIRVDPEDARRSETVARAEEISFNEVFCQALLHYFEHQRAASDFLERASLMTAALGVG